MPRPASGPSLAVPGMPLPQTALAPHPSGETAGRAWAGGRPLRVLIGVCVTQLTRVRSMITVLQSGITGKNGFDGSCDVRQAAAPGELAVWQSSNG